LIEQARRCGFFRSALEELAQALPPEDAELDQAIAQAVATRDERAFRSLYFAALGAGRKVDGRHLAEGSALFVGPRELPASARACTGEVARALLAAVQGSRMDAGRDATALLLARIWCDERGAATPAGFWATARTLARRTPRNSQAQATLAVLAHLGKDEGLTSVLAANKTSPPAAWVASTLDAFRGLYRSSPWAAVPEHRPPTALSGYTVRRAVPRLSRNAPCPCGSGKKYKKCCFDKDQERLLQSSAVEGMTLEEWRNQPEKALTLERLRGMPSYELGRLDPTKVPPALQEHLLDRLFDYKELAAVLRCLESGAYGEGFEFYWDWALEVAGTDRELGVIRRLLALRPDLDQARLPLNIRLLLADEQGAAQLDLVEAAVGAGLRADDDTDQLTMLAHALLESRAPALGVLVARSLLPMLGYWEGDLLLDALLQARDKLELSSDDPFESIFRERFLERPEEPRESEALAEARRNLEVQSDQVNRLRAELRGMYREMEKRRRRAPAALTEPKPTAPDDSAMTDLRSKVTSLQALLKERHSERNQLRRDLDAAREQLATAAERTAPEEPKPEAAHQEDELLLAEPALGKQPVRMPVFPDRFLQTTASLPRAVVRAALVLTARLAGGEPAAFVGLRPLRAWPEVYRQRVGSDYRLLFRFAADRLEVLDLINRRDLDRTIKSRG